MKKVIIVVISVILVILLFFLGVNLFNKKAIKKAYEFVSKVEEKVSEEKIKNSLCNISEDGNLLCDDKEISIDNKDVDKGSLVITDSKVTSMSININGKNLIMTSDGIVINKKKNKFVMKDASGASIPILYTNNLTPVIYDGKNWVVASTNQKWYDYDKQQWANAVILKQGITKDENDIVNIDTEVQGMFVWIPRFEYKIDSEYGRSITDNDGIQVYPGIIDVNFISKDINVPSKNYIIPPAFTFNGVELPGIWISKFDTSTDKNSECYNADNNMNEDELINNYTSIKEKCDNDNLIPYVLPNVKSLRYQSAYNQYLVAKKMSQYLLNMDAHMSKNSEYVATIYLSQSKYGKYINEEYEQSNKYINLNNNVNYMTGCGAIRHNEILSDCNNYVTSYGLASSSTGNITGVYDMSTISYKRVMGYVDTDIEIAGFTEKPNSKYSDIFTLDSETICSSDNCVGQGLNEFYRWGENEDSYTYEYPMVTNPWIIRGSYNAFNFMYDRGIAESDVTFRITLIDNQ